MGGRMFAPTYFTNEFWLARFAMYFLVLLFCLFIGSAAATMFVRWRATGLVVFFGIVAVLLLGGVAFATLNRDWPRVWQWFGDTGPLGLTVWTLLPTARRGRRGILHPPQGHAEELGAPK
ncbi:MAG: hypothetical protein WDM88_12475 [Galbitalea sp.]